MKTRPARAGSVARHRSAMRGALVASLSVVLGCGGGAPDGASVSSMSALPVAWGSVALWTVSGQNLGGDIRFEIVEGRCENPTEAAPPAATQRLFSCRIASVGDIVAQVRAGDTRLARLQVTVPVPTVRLTLAEGSIDVELAVEAAPQTASNFLTYVGSRYYDNTLIHRVIPGFVIQGGGFVPSALGPQIKPPASPPIALESNRGLSNLRGTIAMARGADPDSANSQFYFNLVDNPLLDYRSDAEPGYAVFGRVTSGLDVIDRIAAVPTRRLPELGLADVPVQDVVVTSVRQIR